MKREKNKEETFKIKGVGNNNITPIAGVQIAFEEYNVNVFFQKKRAKWEYSNRMIWGYFTFYACI